MLDGGRALRAWRAVERGFDGAFGTRLNPLRHLGALAVLAFALLAASGTVLYVLLDISAAGAYGSIDALSRERTGLGALLRGLHRYGADAFVLLLGLHVVREWLHGHYAGFRRFSWLTGVPLVVLVFFSAVGGFWLNWDQLGQFSAIATAEWLDTMPLLATPLARNFLSPEAVSDRLFSLFVFVHIGVALTLVFALWFHLQRLTRPEVWPPRRLGAGTLATLALLALVAPVASHAPAALGHAPQLLRLDWWLLFLHPLAYEGSAALAWAVVLGVTAILLALPLLPQRARAPVAVVDPARCNGCRRCLADCPYTAITMVPHPDRRVGRELARVDADLCASCGICAGACPSSTPFRSAAELKTGIDMPAAPLHALRERLRAALRQPGKRAPIVAFGCDRGARVATIDQPGVVGISLPCSGQLPPSFVEYALRDGAAGVLVAACPESGCEYRFGSIFSAERLRGEREPRLRDQIGGDRLEWVAAAAGDEAKVLGALERLRRRVVGLPARQVVHHA
jgi:ferredoxin/coenzyme F420-reducing hydrogenase delta subunit